ncbi:hypothetical protein FisN_22Lu047 [Fistulifera solaris]|uniref:CCHC-type domain-containing protein n=1 Tax=Fistulifera solaris TaxID=1519565 RepID=A0A1Z5JBI5_FISSO|nr:hypothetical protein FisN_22Lu047 [Fistulifera solaris]|eukprot:GAX11354.1 hypothetical protein FisN_22Lu047 [Fistulifera solaris]
MSSEKPDKTGSGGHKLEPGGGKPNNMKKGNRGAPAVGSKFTGACEALKGNIFDCGIINQADLFVKSQKALSIYIGSDNKFKNSSYVVAAVETLEIPTIPAPDPLPAESPASEQRIWDKMVDAVADQRMELIENIKKLYSLVEGQCTPMLINRFSADASFPSIKASRNGVELLKLIRKIAFSDKTEKRVASALDNAHHRFWTYYQKKGDSVAAYIEGFQNRLDVLKHLGGTIGDDIGLINEVCRRNNELVGSLSSEAFCKRAMEASEEAMATRFIKGADRARYKRLQDKLDGDVLQGMDNYPRTLHAAYELLTAWTPDREDTSRYGTANDGAVFVQDGENTEDGVALVNNDGKGKKRTCYRCNKPGHTAPNCREILPDDKPAADNDKNDDGAQLFTAGGIFDDYSPDDDGDYGFQLLNEQGRYNGIPRNWILLDNQSTVDVFCNPGLVTNIRKVNRTLRINTNAGVATTNMMADLRGYGSVWFYRQGIANILSLALVKKKFRVTFDSGDGNAFILHKEDGETRQFQESDGGLYYLEVPMHGTVMVNTVADNASRYTNEEYSRAVLARSIQRRTGNHTTKQMKRLVNANLIPNCPITAQDIQNAEDIFGTDVQALQGKTVRRTPIAVRFNVVNVPVEIMERHHEVTLAGDVMFVNRIPFLITISRYIKFGTVEMIRNRTAKTLLNGIEQVYGHYLKRGFKITHLLMDNEFEPLRGDLASSMKIELNAAAADEHVPEIERHVRTVKERTRSTYNGLPFKHMPPRLIIEMVYFNVFWLNCFPPRDGVSDTLSPRVLISGQQIDYTKHCQLEFGEYVQTHEKHDNSMAPRTVGALALRPTGNAQGSYFFFSLATGKRLHRNRWTKVAMPDEVIERVHLLAKTTQIDEGLEFADRYNHSEHYDPEPCDDASVVPHPDNDDVVSIPEYPNAAGVTETVGFEDPQEAEYVANNEIEIENSNEDGNLGNMDEDDPANADQLEIPGVDDTGVEPEANEEIADEESVQSHDANDENPGHDAAEDEMDARYGPRLHNYNLRQRKPRDYGHLFHQLAEVVNSVMFTQYPVEKGLKIFGDPGMNAVDAELRQLDTRDVIEPEDPGSLTREEKLQALRYLMYLKKKRCGKIKGRGCADGRKQRTYINKEDASSPTASIEAVFLSFLIDAKEKRDVGIVDVPGAFMHAFMDELVRMRISGEMVRILTNINPSKYEKYVVTERGEPVLYVRLKKALYGTLRAAYLFWQLLTKTLEKWGFVINPYDRCVANKMIDGHQCTILWHVDDIKISHVSPEVVTDVIAKLNAEFGKEEPLSVSRGKVHEYLGMTINYEDEGKVTICMTEYVQNIIDELPPEMIGHASTPAAAHLFEVNTEDPVLLNEEDRERFVHLVAKMLYLCKRARPDLQTAIAFLCTRVKAPDEDDWKKLTRVLKYLQSTSELSLTLEADNLEELQWWVDASFAVHLDKRSHTGGILTLGRGAVYSTSTKQKINTTSSTEAELVGVGEVIGQMLWTKRFMDCQGYNTKASIVYQDNDSAILLEKNGKASSSKRTRHIDIRYFHITDRVAAGEVVVKYCPTEEMLADFFTKPLQGSHFIRFRDVLLNLDRHIKELHDRRSVLEKQRETESWDPLRGATSDDACDGETDGWTVVGKKRKPRKAIASVNTYERA